MNKVTRWVRYNLRYFGQPPWDTGVSPPELIQFLQSAPTGKALDMGCGTGTNLVNMASYGWQVVGIDLAWISVIKSRTKLNQAGVRGRVIHGDVSAGVHPGKEFDLVLDIGCYHDLRPRERSAYQANLANWLKPGGYFLLYAHRKKAVADLHGLAEDDFVQLSDFLCCQWREDSVERRPDGGGGHPSTWAAFMRCENDDQAKSLSVTGEG